MQCRDAALNRQYLGKLWLVDGWVGSLVAGGLGVGWVGRGAVTGVDYLCSVTPTNCGPAHCLLSCLAPGSSLPDGTTKWYNYLKEPPTNPQTIWIFLND